MMKVHCLRCGGTFDRCQKPGTLCSGIGIIENLKPIGPMTSIEIVQTNMNGLGDELKSQALIAIREVLTEDNTDALIDLIMDRLPIPFWMRWLPIRSVLDRLLPETLLNVFEDLLS